MAVRKPSYASLPTEEDSEAELINSTVLKSPSAVPTTSKSPMVKYMEALGACLLWLVCSSTIIIVNKYIMVDIGFKYPMAVGAMGMGVSSIACVMVCDLMELVPAAKGVDLRFYWLKIFPVGLTQGFTLFLGNQLYLYLTVAFIEMSRATLPIFTMIALWISGLETPTNAVIQAVSVTAVGCAIAAYGEVHLKLVGALMMLSNLVMESVRLVMTQFLLVGCEMHPLQALKYIAPAATFGLVTGSLILEYPDMQKARAELLVAKYPYHFIAAASMGLVVNILGVVIIKLSSATTLKVLAAVRGPIVVLLGVMLFAEEVSMLEFFGYSIALAGFVWYNFAKVTQSATPHKPPMVASKV